MNEYLIIWLEIPENTQLFKVRLNCDEAKKLEACHNHLINNEDWPEQHWLLELIATTKPIYSDHSNQDKTGIPLLTGKDGHNIKIIVTGFIL